MKTVIKRCAHCLREYVYTMSGNCIGPYNDSSYCSTCKEAIEDALSTIPKVCSIEYIDIALGIETRKLMDTVKTSIMHMSISGELDCVYDIYHIGGKEYTRIEYPNGEVRYTIKSYVTIDGSEKPVPYISECSDIHVRCINSNITRRGVSEGLVESKGLDAPMGECYYLDCLGRIDESKISYDDDELPIEYSGYTVSDGCRERITNHILSVFNCNK